MKKLFVLLMFICCIMLFAGTASATALSFSPSSQEIAIGDSTSVDLIISGLGEFAAPSLGAFLVEVTFDATILSFDAVTYGSFLGDPDPDAFETDILTTVGSGYVSLDEFSFLFDFELDALQPASFTLATLNFTGLAFGSSALGFGAVDLSDAGFPASPLPAELISGEITVAPVPEPSTILLLLSGMAGLGVFGRKKFTGFKTLAN